MSVDSCSEGLIRLKFRFMSYRKSRVFIGKMSAPGNLTLSIFGGRGIGAKRSVSIFVKPTAARKFGTTGPFAKTAKASKKINVYFTVAHIGHQYKVCQVKSTTRIFTTKIRVVNQLQFTTQIFTTKIRVV